MWPIHYHDRPLAFCICGPWLCDDVVVFEAVTLSELLCAINCNNYIGRLSDVG